MKRRSRLELPWKTEAELCEDFIRGARALGWTVYPETAGFDLLLVAPDGRQVGVEAKLRPNLELVGQICDHALHAWQQVPDHLAVLVGRSNRHLGAVSRKAGFEVIDGSEVIRQRERNEWSLDRAPDGSDCENPWGAYRPKHTEHWPRLEDGTKRCVLPSFVPNLQAGIPGPIQLTPWKIKAIRLCGRLRERGWVTTQDFKELGLDSSRWIRGSLRWLEDSGERDGRRFKYVARPGVELPDEQRPELTRQVLAMENV